MPQGRAALDLEGLVFAWCMWLLGSWAVALGPKWLSLGPSVRYMGVAAVVGSMLLWPALRLSQERREEVTRWGLPTPRGLVRAVFDWMGLNLVWFGVAATMAVMGQWHLRQVLLMCVILAAWTMVAGMVITWGRGGSFRRVLAMLICVALVFGGPVATFLWNRAGQPYTPSNVGPLAMMWAATEVNRSVELFTFQGSMVMVLVTAGVAFLLTVGAVVIGSAGGYAGPTQDEAAAEATAPPWRLF